MKQPLLNNLAFRTDMAQADIIGRLSNTFVGNDSRHIVMRGHIKSGISDLNTNGSNWHSTYSSHFIGMALLNRNIVPRREFEINSRTWCNHIERDMMSMSQYSHTVRADFVCDIPICRNTISAHKNGLNTARTHKMASHIICNERQRDIFLL